VSRVLAISDLHVSHQGNSEVLDHIRPTSADDWLIVAGDVAEKVDTQRRTLALLRDRFAEVVWVPGNHDLWTTARDPVSERGAGRYRLLVRMCRALGIHTPEDPYPRWAGPGGPVTVAPLFIGYDYSFLPRGATTKAEGLAAAEARGTVAVDEQLLSHEPYDSREQWCRERVAYTRGRLDAVDPAERLVLVNHFPLVRTPVERLLRAEFGMWCGTELTADWHRRYRVECVVYGHLHIRRTDHFDGVRFEEVSLGYPREWRWRGLPDPLLTQIVPAPRPVGRGRPGAGWVPQHAQRLTRWMGRRVAAGRE